MVTLGAKAVHVIRELPVELSGGGPHRVGHHEVVVEHVVLLEPVLQMHLLVQGGVQSGLSPLAMCGGAWDLGMF